MYGLLGSFDDNLLVVWRLGSRRYMNLIFEIEMLRPWFEPQTPCFSSQERICKHSTTTAPNFMYGKKTKNVNDTALYMSIQSNIIV